MRIKRLNMIVGRGSSGVRSPYASPAGLLWSNTLTRSRADGRRRPCWKATSVDLPFQVSIIQRHLATVSAAASVITGDGEAKGTNLHALQQELIARHDSDDKPMRLLAGTDELEAGTVEWSVPELRDSASVDSGLEHGRNEALESWLCRGAVDNFLPPASCQWLINASEAAARAIPPISDAEFSLYLLGDAAEAVLGPAANDAYNILLRRIKDELEKQTCHGSELRLEIAGAILYRLKAMKPGENEVHVCNAHVDKANKNEYDMSSIMYLNTHGIDFDGGEFVFVDEEASLHIHPRAGRLVYFSSGAENLHKIQPVSSGSRWVVASWFTIVRPESAKQPAE